MRQAGRLWTKCGVLVHWPAHHSISAIGRTLGRPGLRSGYKYPSSATTQFETLARLTAEIDIAAAAQS